MSIYKIISTGQNILADEAFCERYHHGDWVYVGEQPVEPAPIKPLSPRQFRQALTALGLRATVEAAIAAADQDTKDWYEYATSFERTNSVLVAMAAALGKTDADIDELFALGATL